jgi:hypothetical protein
MIVAVEDNLIELKLELLATWFFSLELVKLFELFGLFVPESLLLFFGRDVSELAFGHGTDFAEDFLEFNKGELDGFRVVLHLFSKFY